MSKKLLIIIASVVVILAVIIGVYVFIANRRGPSTPTSDGTTTDSTGILPPVGGDRPAGDTPNDGGLFGTEVKNLPAIAPIGYKATNVLSPTLAADGAHLLYFDKDQKKFQEANLDGSNPQPPANLDKAYDGVTNIIWAPSKTGLILERFAPDQPFTQKTYIDMTDGKETDLNNFIDHLTFSPDGKKIYYQYVNNEKNKITLNISNSDGSDFRVVKDFPIRNIFLSWVPVVDKLMFYLAPSGYRRSTFYLHDQNGENVLSLMEKGYAVDGVWSPKGSRLLATWAQENTKRMHLRAISIKGSDERSMLGIKTFIDKCVWSNDPADDIFVYCAVPREISTAAVLPEDYNAGKLDLIDDFYRINTKTGEKVLIAESPADKPIDAHDLVVHRSTEADDVLYFVNRKDGNALWEINLSKVKFPEETPAP